MRVRYTRAAIRDLDRALTYLVERNPEAAIRVGERIRSLIELLLDRPLTGPMTDRPGQRRLVANPYPFVIFYRVRGSELIVQRIRHAARRPL